MTTRPRLQILTVDDAKVVRELAKRALAPLDAEFHEAANGFDALYVMEKALPDLLLLDVNMPIMGGVELLAMMRSNVQLASIPVVMLTSPADHAILPQLTALGVAAILQKPFTEAGLLETTRAALKLGA